MINFSEEQIKVLETALNTYGFQNQSDILIEEMSELTKAIIKYRRYKTADCFDAICEEIADVAIMLEQMIIIAEFSSTTDIESFVKYKINRLAERLENKER